MSIPLCTELEQQYEQAEPTAESIAISRRSFLQAAGALSAAAAVPGLALGEQNQPGIETTRSMTLRINGVSKTLTLDTRTSLLDALRENLQLTGSKKGCDHGQCAERARCCLTAAG